MAGDLDEGRLEVIGLPQLGVGALQLLVLDLQFGQQTFAFDEEVVLFAGLPDDAEQLVGVPGLGDVAVDVALVDGIDDGLDVGIAREQ